MIAITLKAFVKMLLKFHKIILLIACVKKVIMVRTAVNVIWATFIFYIVIQSYEENKKYYVTYNSSLTLNVTIP